MYFLLSRPKNSLNCQLYTQTFVDPIKTVTDRNILLAHIRKQPGFEGFLRPKSYNVLCHAFKGGAVIMLTSHKDHCDAIIILNPTSDPIHVPLPHVTLDGLKSQRDTLKALVYRCNLRNRGQSSSSRIFAGCEQFSHKPVQEYFEDMLNWLNSNVVSLVHQVLKSVSRRMVLFILLDLTFD
jgi:hypothetical protein